MIARVKYYDEQSAYGDFEDEDTDDTEEEPEDSWDWGVVGLDYAGGL